MSAACFAAKAGHEVTVFEKNAGIGGRARQFSENGFVFDMGPSWYWMPDVFENFFNQFGKATSEYYNLIQLNPGFRMVFDEQEFLDVPAGAEDQIALFESIEPGAGTSLRRFLDDAELKYKEGMLKLAYMPGLSWTEFLKPSVMRAASGLNMFTSVRRHVRSYFKDRRLVMMMEFPVLFLGAMPQHIPALYTLMNYAALRQGTFYPMGGMFNIIDAMHKLAQSLGVKFETGTAISKIGVSGKNAHAIHAGDRVYPTDAVIATGDYHHVEQMLLEPKYRNYTEAYWDKKVLAPSSLIFYIGVSKKLPNLLHHNLFFDTDFEVHSKEIYDTPKWPTAPLFYVSCPSKTDETVAPAYHENLFILIPVAPGLDESLCDRDAYYEKVMVRLEKVCRTPIREHVVYRKSYCVNDFKADYNAYKGNAYGLANTLPQTAVLKPRIKNAKVANLFYAGQLTVPGPGVPPSLISGELAAQLTNNHLKSSI